MATVLIGDDDASICESLRRLFTANGFSAEVAHTGSEAIARAGSLEVRLLLLDLHLPDMTGIDVVRALHATGVRIPFILISGYATIPITVEAMRLGAEHVIEKPFQFANLLAVAHRAFRPEFPNPPSVGVSIPERWAQWVLAAVDSPQDIRTLGAWARLVGVSYSSLREGCYLVGVRPHDAKDFARALRVAVRLGKSGRVHDLVDMSDRRTLTTFCERSGLEEKPSSPHVVLQTFLRRQRLIPADNTALTTVREQLRQRRLI